jgi:hypothetical protein
MDRESFPKRQTTIIYIFEIKQRCLSTGLISLKPAVQVTLCKVEDKIYSLTTDGFELHRYETLQRRQTEGQNSPIANQRRVRFSA